jgi:tRNA A37 threonylcarbamoyladenosine modification protein TsaB
MNSLALLAAGAPGEEPVAAAVTGGHGELFVQQFTRAPMQADGTLLNLSPSDAATLFTAPLVVGNGSAALVAARGWGETLDLLPSAANALRLPLALAGMLPKPIYARAPDARPRAA